jgi:formylglycine-generating enzyme required for sulfatase activity
MSHGIAFTIRTDSFPELQKDRRFSNLNARGYDLRALPVFRFESVIESPAKRYGVAVDDALVDVLIEHSPREDALPLLAFALQRLWRQYASSKSLNKDHYNRVGGLRGLIEDAAERALRGLGPETDAGLPHGPPPQQRIDLAASTFVPTLVQVNDQGAMIRRIAEWQNFTSEQQELIGYFDQWRLVVRKGGDHGGTVEVAHEALFREWTRLKSWLEPERARLDALRALQVDALTWDRNGQSPAFLNHRNKRLADAQELTKIEAYRKRLTPLDLGYLVACQLAERAAQNRARSVRAVIYSLLIGIIGGLLGWIFQDKIVGEWRWIATEHPFATANIRPYVLTAADERALKSDPNKSFRECAPKQPDRDFCPDMIVLQPGSFIMGSPPSENGRDDEHPQHRVTIEKAVAVSKFPLTWDQWKTCVQYGDCRPDVPDGNLGRGQRPVINVSWDDAKQYVHWLSIMTGKEYRLLTEAEYEYAERAGTQTRYPWADEIGTNNADCKGCGSKWDTTQTAPIGSFPANG